MFTFERVNNLQNVITLIEIQNNCFYCQMLSFQQVGLSLHMLILLLNSTWIHFTLVKMFCCLFVGWFV